MPRNSRAYAVSILAMASGLGAGVAVIALPLADISPSSWRAVYVVALVWLPIAVSISRHLPETVRFQRPHIQAPPLPRRRFLVVGAAAFLGNLFVAPASLFQNGYLADERGFGRSDRTVHPDHRHPGRGWVDHRRPIGRHRGPTPHHRGGVATDHRRAGRLLQRQRPADVDERVRGRHPRRHHLPSDRRLPNRAVPHRQPQPGRRAARPPVRCSAGSGVCC